MLCDAVLHRCPAAFIPAQDALQRLMCLGSMPLWGCHTIMRLVYNAVSDGTDNASDSMSVSPALCQVMRMPEPPRPRPSCCFSYTLIQRPKRAEHPSSACMPASGTVLRFQPEHRC